MAEPKPLTAADVAAKLKSHKVRVHAVKNGAPVRDKEGNYKVIERNIKAGDIVSFTERDGVITAVTVDGQKLTA
jgi:co-chaperonin GroES (HSP10)